MLRKWYIVHVQYVNLNARQSDGYCDGKTCGIFPVIGTKKTSEICNVIMYDDGE